VLDGVLGDVVEAGGVVLFRLDHPGPEALAEDVVLAAVARVECLGVLAVEVPHAVRQVRERRLEEQVVVVAEQAAGVDPPAEVPANSLQDLEEDGAVVVVLEDRRVVVPFGRDVVVGAGGKMAGRASHVSTVTGACERERSARSFDAAA